MKKSRILILIGCLCLILSGCFQGKGKFSEGGASSINKEIKKMSLDEKIGQLMVIGLDGTTFSQEMDNLIRNYHVGGIIIMGKNISTAQDMLKLINNSKKTNEHNKIPLFISVDEEGGEVSRLPEEFKKLPSNGEIGNRNDEEFSYRVGTYLAEALNEFGYNMNFAPVLDVNSNPQNPVIGSRSFGEDPEQVATLGISTMRGMMDKDVIPVVKHFPGHGDTYVDSHKALPVVNTTLDSLQELELIPFQRAIDEGVDAVMVAHILYPELDPEYPSSLSKVIITDLLREKMQFDGVVITDDLTMGAIKNEYTIPEAALQSFIAGSDLLLVVHGYNNEIRTINALKNAVETGAVSEERVDESLKRILTLKRKYGITDEEKEFVDVESVNRLYDELTGS